ncbi:MAG: hydrogenase maturation protease [Cyanothece sp. SIO1E1]|nr:hydrogenase maturation protease [Cyanothece sp. SIO1E1]
MDYNLSSKLPSFVVIGYGSELRSDDAIGPRISRAVADWQKSNVRSLCVQQLTPELSEVLAEVDYAIFADACRMDCPAGARVKILNPCGSETAGCSIPALGHTCDPQSLLALTQSVYGHYPPAWWVEVSAENFEVGDRLSAVAEQGVVAALEQIEQLIHSHSHAKAHA